MAFNTFSDEAPAETNPAAAQLQRYVASFQYLEQNPHLDPSEIPGYAPLPVEDVAENSQLVMAAAAHLSRALTTTDTSKESRIIRKLLALMLSFPVALTSAQWQQLLAYYGFGVGATSRADHQHRSAWFPLLPTLEQLEAHALHQGLAPELRPVLTDVLLGLENYFDSDERRNIGDTGALIRKAEEILGLEPGVFVGADPFGRHLNQFVAGLAPGSAAAWQPLLRLWQRARGERPTAQVGKALAQAVAAIGPDAVRQQGQGLLEMLAGTAPKERLHGYVRNGHAHQCIVWEYLRPANLHVARGLVWTLQPLADATGLRLLADLATRGLSKPPPAGPLTTELGDAFRQRLVAYEPSAHEPLAAGLGSACLRALAHNGLPGAVALAWVGTRLQQRKAQQQVARLLAQAAPALHLSPAAIGDLARARYGS